MRKQKIYRLVFDDGDMAGFVVRVKSTSFGRATEAQGIEAEVELLGECLVDWNLERTDGTPVPCDLENLRAQDPALIKTLLSAFSDALMGVSDPLVQSSHVGQQSPEASLPMEPLSPSRAS